MTDPGGPAWREWERRRDLIRKPRVTWCEYTRKWIMNENGHRHTCGSGSYKSDLAFRRWADAMDEANFLYRERVRAMMDMPRKHW